MKKTLFALFVILTAAPAFGQQLILKGSTAYICEFTLIDSSDHIASKTGLGSSVTVIIGKNGGSKATPHAGGTVSEIGQGDYKFSLDATDTGTTGLIKGYATATGADPTNFWCGQVVEFDPRAVSPTVGDLAVAVQEEPCASHTTSGTIGDTICDRSTRVYPASTAFIHTMQFVTSAGALVTSGTPSCTRRIDSGSFSGTTNSASAVDSNGLSRITLSTSKRWCSEIR